MTTMSDVDATGSTPGPAERGGVSRDRRGSWVPTGGMIATRFMELRKRRGLLIALVLVTVGIPTIFLVIRLLLHAFAPHSYGPAGGYDIFTGLVAGVLYIFGFIVAATLGATAGSADLGEGMFRHLVVTGARALRCTWLGSQRDSPSSCPWWRWASPSSAPYASSPRQPGSSSTV
jgi:hypothetical protein